MEIVQRLLQADKLEREQQGKQKEELKMEMALYRENLANFKKHEINREKEIERLYREEEDRVIILLFNRFVENFIFFRIGGRRLPTGEKIRMREINS